MEKVTRIKSLLQQYSNKQEKPSRFFKTGPGQYAEHDQFIGVKVPLLRKLAKEFKDLTFKEIQLLLESKINEERFLGLLILVHQYQDQDIKNEIFAFYLKNLKYVNNWNLVDASCHLIVGAHLWNSEKKLLFTLAKSEILWQRRIAIVSTWYFIRKSELEWTFTIAKILLNDEQDLIHKAVGWMLRETGKKNEKELRIFLDEHASNMPRTMLRYAIEKFPEAVRKSYLQTPIKVAQDVSY